MRLQEFAQQADVRAIDNAIARGTTPPTAPTAPPAPTGSAALNPNAPGANPATTIPTGGLKNQANQAQPPAKKPANLTNVLKYLAKGDWSGAILAGALTMAPELKPYLTPDQWRVLNYAINTYGAINFWTGLSAFAARFGVPFLALAGWSSKLNSNEKDELERRRQMGPTLSKN